MKTNLTPSAARAAAAIILFPVCQAGAVVSYTGGTYTQDFNSLASSGASVPFTDDSTLNGWTAYSGDTLYSGTGPFPFTLGTANAIADAYSVDNGGSGTGEFYSYGTPSAPDRALGSLASGTPDEFFFALQVSNDTGFSATDFTLRYDGEQWRRGANTTQRAESLLFFYRIGGAAFDATGTWTSVSLLNFVSPEFSAPGATPLDGNLAVNRATLSQTLTVSIPAGDFLRLAWVDPDNAGTDHGMALDNVELTLTTVPEPSAALLAAPLALLTLRRRRR